MSNPTKGGRKSYFEELKIADRYSALSEPYFLFLKKMLDSEDKTDKKWAAERLEKAYIKMIPQDITSGGQALNITFDNSFNETSSETTGNSKE